MPKVLLILLTISLAACTTQKPPKDLIPWDSPTGIKRLEQSKHKADFFKLANQFESQTNKIFCGPTTAAIVLNALRLNKPGHTLPTDTSSLTKADYQYLPKGDWSPFYPRYTQHNVLEKSPKARAFVLGKPQGEKDGKPFKDYGFQLKQLQALFEAHKANTHTVVVADDTSGESLKRHLIENLKTANDYAIVNYHRKSLGQNGAGHISPLGAYHKPSDSFLILDVNPNHADWVWVTSKALMTAMRTFDTVSNRGFILVRDDR